jgi:hypothetical protein
MRTSIGSAIAGAVAYLIRNLGPTQATFVVRPATAQALPPHPGDAPANDTPTIKIEVNVKR